jgi:poly [ADP-ribose] polymerase
LTDEIERLNNLVAETTSAQKKVLDQSVAISELEAEIGRMRCQSEKLKRIISKLLATCRICSEIFYVISLFYIRMSTRASSRKSTAPSTPTEPSANCRPKRGKAATVKVEEKIEKPVFKKVKASPVRAVAEVDIFVPGREGYRVIEDSGLACTAMLNQTNLADNNNKFFLIQALEATDGKSFATWFRWGRVGYSGQTNLTSHISAESATDSFKSKFFDKTENEWNKTIFKSFKAQVKKYTLLPVETLTQAVGTDGSAAEVVKVEYEASKLETAIFDLIKLISSKEMFESELEIAGIDLTKMPLGTISSIMIKEGYKVLKLIETELNRTSGAKSEELKQLSGRFYTVIPHNFRFNKMISFIINSSAKVREKIELLETLDAVKQGVEMKFEPKINVKTNPVDEQYARLGAALTVVSPSSEEYDIIQRYKVNTQGSTHTFQTSIKNIYRIHTTRPKKLQNTTLLWHGSRLTNWMSILSQGLRIAPPEAPHTGFMFGKGIYTADCFSKAAQYCFASEQTRSRRGLLVLCEVALGKSFECQSANHDAEDFLGSEFASTKGCGQSAPSSDEVAVLEGAKVPLGKLSPSCKQSSLLYNEYIVYDPSRVRMKYLVEVEFTSFRRFWFNFFSFNFLLLDDVAVRTVGRRPQPARETQRVGHFHSG